jgi:uncharacterized protein YbaR (Trm112 family)
MMMSATNASASPKRLDPAMLNMLVCPVSRGQLEYDKNGQRLISKQAGLAFPIRDGVPILLVDEAEPIDD